LRRFRPGRSAVVTQILSAILIGLFLGFADTSSAQRRGRGPGGPAGEAGAGAAEGLTLRSIGPAVTSGRIIAFAVDPKDPTHYFVAAASGGVWKTRNAGTSFTPVFDNEGSYSIGAIAMDSKNPNVVWVGTGECNAQRSVGYGDGVYRSDDDGKTWRDVGLKASEHIGRIAIDPRDSNIVYVAAQGPLWGPGGDRGLYKTTDGGKSWKKSLNISENTGVTDVVVDPRNPDTVYAAAWQRRRHVFTYIGGGPESGIHKSTDGGTTWTRLRGGLPGGDMGRIGLAISPADPDYLYATVEAEGGGIYRSTDYGASWEKRGDTLAQGMYYGQIVCDPKDPERVYIPSVTTMVSEDGGRTATMLGESKKHVDNHALWIDPNNTRHLLEGSDGGAYESFDRGATWVFKSNLPLAQFYRIAADNSKPFYYVYGGTQDNNSVGGPSRTKSSTGITNGDWFVTAGGDGFHQQVDPKDPNTVYSESQDGGLVRFDRKTGLRVGIVPVSGKGEPPHKFYWDAPLVISPHSHKRLHFGGNILFRSDDRGDSWRAVSPDLTRKIDRNALKVMGKVQGLTAIERGQSTSFYGNIISLSESPKKEGLIWAGTDDGLIQVTEDGGKTWRKIEKVEGVPENTYVGRLLASQQDPNAVYALFDNHKNADFLPYVMKSADLGKTWTSIVGDLPKNGPALSIAEDHINPSLLFVGTEFGLFYTTDGGKKWSRLRGGLPTIPVRDLVIQKRDNDLVVGTFGRGIYIVDDYSPLRQKVVTTGTAVHRIPVGEPIPKPEMAEPELGAELYPVRSVTAYVQTSTGTGVQGETFYAASNPPYGAVITYSLKEGLKTLKQKREDAEKEAEKKGAPLPFPTVEQLRAEAAEDPPALILTVADSEGNVVRRLTGPAAAGTHRVTWDLRGPPITVAAPAPTGAGARGGRGGGGGFGGGGGGFAVMPGEYKVSLAKRVNEAVTVMQDASFRVMAEGEGGLKTGERAALADYRRKVGRLQVAVTGAAEVIDTLNARLSLIKQGIQDTPGGPPRLRGDAIAIERKLRDIDLSLRGDDTSSTLVQPSPMTVTRRISDLSFSQLTSPLPPTQTRVDSYKIAAEEFAPLLARLRVIVQQDVPRLEKELDAAGVPHTPGRLPIWKPE
jgi:photosystem II stability/assembly factor-like uncharacterized protein